ncbi:MAG: DUF721 domain-containing protein [Gammaproteobacteria bacterium]|nr:DUF721 domain-containing protein [Gammaproteobacteria bacterium]
MSKSEAKSLSELIGASGSGLAGLAREARKRASLTDHLRSNISAPLGDGIQHCDLRPDGTLVVAATSPEWAAKLRYAEAELRSLCTDIGQTPMSVKVRVAS